MLSVYYPHSPDKSIVFNLLWKLELCIFTRILNAGQNNGNNNSEFCSFSVIQEERFGTLLSSIFLIAENEASKSARQYDGGYHGNKNSRLPDKVHEDIIWILSEWILLHYDNHVQKFQNVK